MLYFMGLKNILMILNPLLPEHAHYSLSMSAFVCTWVNSVGKPIVPKPLGYSIPGPLRRPGGVF